MNEMARKESQKQFAGEIRKQMVCQEKLKKAVTIRRRKECEAGKAAEAKHRAKIDDLKRTKLEELR